MGMVYERQLSIPAELKEMYPLTAKMNETVQVRKAQLVSIFEGRDKRLILIIGPCSADNEDSVMDYIGRLAPVQEKVKDKIFIVPRIYTNKPRTTAEGYKGMLHQPDPTEKPNLFKGIEATRHMHMRAVMETGFACADEMLYTENYGYLDDLLAYVAVGARSVEDHLRRLYRYDERDQRRTERAYFHIPRMAGAFGRKPPYPCDTSRIHGSARSDET